MGIPTLIKTLTADGDSSLSFVDGTADVTLDSTYDEYMFVCTDINPATNTANFEFQVSIDGGSNYNVTTTSTYFQAGFREDGGATNFAYNGAEDLAQGTAFSTLSDHRGSDTDESVSGILNLYLPASTTYIKHWQSRMGGPDASASPYANDDFAAGYFNDTNDVNAIQFKMSSGNFDGVIQMYGIS